MARRETRPKPNVRDLRIYLIKADFTSDDQICKDMESLETLELKEFKGMTGKLYLQEPRPHPPKWAAFVQPNLAVDATAIAKLMNQSTSALLILSTAGRRWAFTFGYGRALINPEAIVRDFGLKVVLNRIKADSIRSVDCRNVDAVTLHTRRQASRGSGIDAFGLDVSQDMLRQVTGIPEDLAFGRRLTGSDVLAIAVPLHFEDLGNKCSQLLEAYNDDHYKQHFAFVDRIRSERDIVVVRELDNKLAQQLKSRKFEKMHLAPPEIIEWENVEGFCLDHDPKSVWHDLDVAEVMGVASSREEVTPQQLRNLRIAVVQADSLKPRSRWTLYGCLVCELTYKKKVYVLSGGEWFEVDKDFVSHINTQIQQISKSRINLPTSQIDEHEGDYNSRASQALRCLLFDKKCKRIDGDPIEPCDLFTDKLQFVHVKRKTQSATLSHLFSQGVVSAFCFVDEPKFRKEVTDEIAKWRPDVAAKIGGTKINPSDFEVVYAIVAKPHNDWPLSLPFFSKVNLVNAHAALKRSQYRCSLVCVPNQPTKPAKVFRAGKRKGNARQNGDRTSAAASRGTAGGKKKKRTRKTRP